jgi:hypothetical protein
MPYLNDRQKADLKAMREDKERIAAWKRLISIVADKMPPGSEKLVEKLCKLVEEDAEQIEYLQAMVRVMSTKDIVPITNDGAGVPNQAQFQLSVGARALMPMSPILVHPSARQDAEDDAEIFKYLFSDE